MRWLEESTIYQQILWKGRLAEARRFLVLLGQEKLGPLSEPAMAAIYDMEDVDRLEKLGKRLLSVDSWEAFAHLPFQEVLGLEESVTYQAIVRKGRLAEARRFLLLIGEEQLGPPSEAARAAVNALADADQVEQLGKRLPHVDSWEALLELPPRRRRNGRRQANG